MPEQSEEQAAAVAEAINQALGPLRARAGELAAIIDAALSGRHAVAGLCGASTALMRSLSALNPDPTA